MTEADDQQPAPELQTLASQYIADQHATYLRHLESAVQNSRNLNIALTGRYGTGKSSVLDEFASTSEQKTLRVTISSLGPVPAASEGMTLTNQIQKELVKQLVYRASPRHFRHSRFNRIVPLSRRRAVLESVLVVGVVGGILAFLKLLPAVAGTGAGNHWLVRVLAWLAFAALAVAVLATLRMVIYGRFAVSDVSAAGATVKLSARTSTYFDEYLEEIVYFFDNTFPDVVIFEDLDRFDDPHIFESLRELNTLLNQTARRREADKPLRFVYAMKDSLFERLGADTVDAANDAAAAETERANRTKFFDLVIPVVPFISHRNARELLVRVLEKSGVKAMDRPLVALVAQHATDMRLLTNICNEYVVFAQRLLGTAGSAPGLTSARLFALVAYKNFHLKDYEQIARRSSDLDRLYELRRELVRTGIEEREAQKRDILAGVTKFKTMDSVARQLGVGLEAIGFVLKAASTTGHAGWPFLQFSVGSARFDQDEVQSYEFWAAVAENGQIGILARSDNSTHPVGSLSWEQIEGLLPEAGDRQHWEELDTRASQEAVKRLDQEIASLRAADFKDLVRDSRFTLSGDDGEKKTFGVLVDTTLKSQLARELMKQGYLDQNFALYAAQFYGHFTGVDVANFIVQSVQPNIPNVHQTFKGADAVDNLLSEAGEDFCRTVSAYNIQVLEHLLRRSGDRAKDIADTVASDFGEHAQKFLRAYLNSGSEREAFVALLSKRPWRDLFTYLVQEPGIPEGVRAPLVDAALHDATTAQDYVLGQEVRDFIAQHYLEMPLLTRSKDGEAAARVVEFLGELGVVFGDLSGVEEVMRNRIVQAELYRITANNLRVVLGRPGDLSLDALRDQPRVFDFCLRRLDEYVAAVRNDSLTPHAVLTEATLIEVLGTISSAWSEDQVRDLIELAAPGSRIERLESVPSACWQDLAARHLFRPTVHNVRAYSQAIGVVDEQLAGLLVRAESIAYDDESEASRAAVAVAVLNAAGAIPDARQRVSLAVSFPLQERLPPSRIEPEPGNLLALLLKEGVVEDGPESFARFHSGGWEAIGPAITASTRFVEFMTPELVSGFVPSLLRSEAVPGLVKDTVVGGLMQYVPADDDRAALAAAGQYALSERRPLPADQVRRVAAAVKEATSVIRLLLGASPVASPAEIAAALSELGAQYSNLVSRAQVQFEVPDDEEHRKILDVLKKDGGPVADYSKKRGRPELVVKLR